MPRATHHAAKTAQRSATMDAIKLLMADHKEVTQLFGEYHKLAEAEADEDEREELAQKICAMLTVHTTIEEELFYPAARSALEDQMVIDEAVVEHASAKELIQQIESSSPGEEPLYDAKVEVLGEYVRHHIKEEEGELFPQLKEAEVDLEDLGEQLQQRKKALMEEMGMPSESTAH